MQSVIEDFKRTISESYAQLARVSEGASAAPITPEKWSRKEVLGHLIDSASNNHQRFVRAQLDGGVTLPGYTQEAWVERQGYKDEPWADLVMLWKSYNLHLLHVVSRMPDDKLGAMCAIGNNEPVTLGFLVEDYVKHMKHHLKQILG
ncbi:MAG TPA: DinB family protein [Blastocatellia bacterium]|nr:DinB family protein [Blastocatellia bacterium]